MRAALRVLRSLDPPARALVVRAALLSAERGGRAWLVGGVVRDALVGRLRSDLDLALELPSAAAVGPLLFALRAAVGGELQLHPPFGTGTLEVAGFHLDVALTRSERYPHPAALPRIAPAPIRTDLLRRDFTVNALAVALPPAAPALLDPFGGVADLDAGVLRTLQPRSLADDPTRIVRGARLAARLGFGFAPSVARQVAAFLGPEVLRFLSYERRRDELELLLAEPAPGAALTELADVGALEPLYGVPLDRDLRAALDRLDRERLRERPDGAPPERPATGADADPLREAYLLLLAGGGAAGAGWLARFGLPQRLAGRAARVDELAGRWRGRAQDAADPAFTQLATSERLALGARLPELRERLAEAVGIDDDGRERRKLRGSDVLRLGLSEGPDVGRILRLVAQARAAGRVRDYEGELQLARALIDGATPGSRSDPAGGDAPPGAAEPSGDPPAPD